MKQVHVIVTGFVQGVGFRKFVRHHARSLHIVGWTRNLSDGTVEVVAIGEENNLRELLTHIQKGPLLATVDNTHIEWEDAQEDFTEFIIKRE